MVWRLDGKKAVGLLLLMAFSQSRNCLANGSWLGNGPFGGVITELVTAPTIPPVAFAGTAAGVYKSVDGGRSWDGPKSGVPAIPVRGLAIDASNADRVFAAVDYGLYRSTDGGSSWIRVYRPGDEGLPRAVTVDYRDGNRVYASTTARMLRSVDGGDSWTVDESSAVSNVTAIEVSRTSGSVYACGGNVFRSDDDGESWTSLKASCYGLVVLSTTPETILVGNDLGTGIQKSIDRGVTWKFSNMGLPFGPMGFCNSCTLPVTALAADPQNPNLVFAGLYGGGVFTSTNGGSNWERGATGVAPDARVLNFAFSAQSVLVGTGDGGVYAVKNGFASPSNDGLKASYAYSLALTPTARALAATGGGVFRSDDGGASWAATANPGPGTFKPGVWAHPSRSGLIFAATEYGGLLRSENDGQSWRVVVGDGEFLQITAVGFDPGTPGRILAGAANLPHSPYGMRILLSSDYGATWEILRLNSSNEYVTWFGFDKFDDSIVFARTGEFALMRSTDHGIHWDDPPVSSFDEFCVAPHAVVLNPWGEHAIYSSGLGRSICRSDDDGLTFHATWINWRNLPPISDLHADPVRPGTFYGASSTSDGSSAIPVISSDRGETWSDFPAGFPGTEILSMAVDDSGSKLFVGTMGSGVVSTSLPVDVPKPSSRCVEDGSTLCLQSKRFGITVNWVNQHSSGRTGVGTPIPATDQSGYFWFFDPDSVELVLKIVDGRSVNQHFWIFYGGLSDVEFTITVQDFATGVVEHYYNAPGDICGGADTGGFADSGTGSTLEDFAQVAALALGSLSAEVPFTRSFASSPVTTSNFPCTTSAENLCLSNNRFQVSVRWRNQHSSGQTGIGTTIPASDQSGYFWFFSPDSVELVVKIIDGTALNGKFWVFYGALSDVEYDITVRDTFTGAVKTYHNEPGDICGGADTSAF